MVWAYVQNLEAVLKGAGMTLKNVVKANIYLSNLSRDFNAMNEVSAQSFPAVSQALSYTFSGA